jgi:hypothetical protein
MAKIQQPTMTFLALDSVQMNLDLMGWQIAMYRSTVNAVRDRAARKTYAWPRNYLEKN